MRNPLRVIDLIQVQQRNQIISGYPDGTGLYPNYLGKRPVHFFRHALSCQARFEACPLELGAQTPTLNKRTGTGGHNCPLPSRPASRLAICNTLLSASPGDSFLKSVTTPPSQECTKVPEIP